MTVCYFRRGDIPLAYFMVMMLLTTEALNADYSCSDRPDGRCEWCDGTPQCFDLSDEIGCLNSTINLVPISAAIEICRGERCLKGFPEPPPLPPFSLCDDIKIPTTVSPATKMTGSQTTKSKMTTPATKASIPPPHKSTLPPSRITTEILLPTTRTTATQTEATTTTTMPSTTTSSSYPYFPTWPWTTHRWTTRRWPVTPTTTATPPLSTTQWCSTTTTTTATEPHAPPFMEVWRFCAARHYFTENIISCIVCYFTPKNCPDTRPQVTTKPNPWQTDWHQKLFPVQTARPGFIPSLPRTLAPFGYTRQPPRTLAPFGYTRQPPRTMSPLVPTRLFHTSPVQATDHTRSKLPPETRHSAHPARPQPSRNHPAVLDSNESNYLSNEQTSYDFTDMMYLQLFLEQMNK